MEFRTILVVVAVLLGGYLAVTGAFEARDTVADFQQELLEGGPAFAGL